MNIQSKSLLCSSIDLRIPPFFCRLPSTTVDEAFVLWCLIDGKDTPLKIIFSPRNDVSDLKLAIWNAEKHRFSGVGISDMVISKLNRKIPLEPCNTLTTRIQLDDFAQLEPNEKLLDAFAQKSLDVDHLHVFVTKQAAFGKRSCSPVEEDSWAKKRRKIGTFDHDIHWLEEIRSKIWGREDLKLLLFRKVEVTGAHYTELQERLTERYPNRGSPGYDGHEHNVLNVKLDTLLSYNPSRHNHNQVNSNDDPESNIKDLFEADSFSLNFLDLSSLDLENPPPGLPLPLFLRPEYDYISKLIVERPGINTAPVIVSGQPGTGKTAYLHLLIIKSMIEGRPFLYQALSGNIYYIADCVIKVPGWSQNEQIVAYIDGDNPSQTLLLQPFVQIMVTSPPVIKKRPWVKQAGFFSDLITSVMDLWSLRELFLTGIFLHPFDISFELLRESASYFGYNPRRCFLASQSMAMLKHCKEVESEIREATNTSTISQLLSFQSIADVSHTVFELSPIDESRFLFTCQVRAVSPWALDLLMKAYETRQTDFAAYFYRLISDMPEAESLRGPLLAYLLRPTRVTLSWPPSTFHLPATINHHRIHIPKTRVLDTFRPQLLSCHCDPNESPTCIKITACNEQ